MNILTQYTRSQKRSPYAWIAVTILGIIGASCSDQIQSPTTNAPEIDPTRICIVSHYTENMESFAKLAVANHQAYAEHHGYKYRHYVGRISGDLFRDKSRGDETTLFGGGLYWQKIIATKKTLLEKDQSSGQPLCLWAMWLDSDAVFTNFHQTIENMIHTWGTQALPDGRTLEKSLLISRDESDENELINNGVFIIKNNTWSMDFLASIEASYPNYKDNLLPEQDAFRDFIFQVMKASPDSPKPEFNEKLLLPEVSLIKQRAFNSFHRPGYKDNVDCTWQKCDFIAHISGTRAESRVQEIQRISHEVSDCGSASHDTFPPPLPI